MRFKIGILQPAGIPGRALLLALLFLLAFSSAPAVRAQTGTSGITLVTGTVVLSDDVSAAILSSLNASTSLYPGTLSFAVTDWRQQGAWAIASVMGLAQVHDGNTWTIDDGSWFGLVLLHRRSDGGWRARTQGTRGFSDLMRIAPDRFIDATAKRHLDPLQAPSLPTESVSGYVFPLQAGTLMYYGSLGVHANGFSSVVDGWKAVDLLSDGNTTLNHAPNRLLAAEAGTISYACKDNVNVAIKVGDFFYTHLVDNANLFVTKTFVQGGFMGRLKTGNFKGPCGWATQPAGWFHVHWGFPNANLHVEDWTLSMTTQNWSNGTATVQPGSWMLAGPTPDMPLNLHQTSATQNTIDFAWDASPDAEGYRVYSWNGSAYVLLDSVPPTQTSYEELRSACGWSQLYKVSAYNYIGESRRAGPLQTYTVPCTPSLLSPGDGSLQAWNYDATLRANAANGATGYLVEFWGQPFASAQSCGWSLTPSCHAGPLPPGYAYAWHVKARSSAGETGWSPTWTFTTRPIPCYTLSLSFTGSGDDLQASPSNTAGCNAGMYHPGENISLTASPALGWAVDGWDGTDNDASTSTTNTITMPDRENTSTVNYGPIMPGVPVLVSPAKGATWQPINIALDWNAASGALSYDYCLSTSTTCNNWISTGTSTSVSLSNLDFGTLYYWQVRDTNEYGHSSLSARWSFTTVSPPGAFSKSLPGNAATGQRADVRLQWAASPGADEYQYCIDTVNDSACQDGSWLSAGSAQSADLAGTLSPQTTYYWQVRAVNSFGTTPASGGWWSFTTSGVPGPFSKKSPAAESTGVPVHPTLKWSSSQYTTQYEYCIDQSDDNACDGDKWLNAGATIGAYVSDQLLPLTTYHWQVRAVNGFGAAVSDGGSWRSFTTGELPQPFGKSSPANESTDQQLNFTLRWAASTGAASYKYCVSTTNGSCPQWVSTGTATSASLTGLKQHTTYYWEVRAVNAVGAEPADGSTWWSFTTGYLPGSFDMLAPANNAFNVSLSPALSWGSSAHASSYAYCFGTTSTCGKWVSVGSQASVTLAGLQPGTQYYWRVRARNAIGVTSASGGYRAFRTGFVPGAFGKISPLQGAVGQPVAGPLTWASSSGAAHYEYCIDRVNDGLCEADNWIRTGILRRADLSSLALSHDATYYWQVRAVNGFGTTLASGAWWRFTTAP